MNGDYYHANPEFYEPESRIALEQGKYKKASEIWARDFARQMELEELGYTVVVIWENELKQYGSGVLESIPA